jgi:hypothetical protein
MLKAAQFISQEKEHFMTTPHRHLSLCLLLVSLAIGGVLSAPLATRAAQEAQTTPAVVSFTLINADTDQPVPGYDPIPQDVKLDLAKLPTRRLSVRANTNPAKVGSVTFAIDDYVTIRTENFVPYSVAGDSPRKNGRDYLPWKLPSLNIQHGLIGIPYSKPNSGSAPGTTYTLRFTLVDSGAQPTTTAQPSATATPTTPAATATPKPTTTPIAGETRDPWLWPFAQDSIWNMPIGANARYEAANLKPAGWTGSDPELFYKVPAGAPERPIYDPASWTKRCAGTAVADPGRRKTLPIPNDLIVADAAPPSTPNNAAAFLLPDGRTLVQLNPLARCERGGPVYGWTTKDLDIYGPGVEGGHGGSGMSSFGGSIRVGELTGAAPIRHALKVNVWGQLYLHYNKNEATPGYRWPALRADGYAANNDCTRWGDPNKYACYGGANPKLEMGALLAIPPGVNEASLNLQTPAARKLFRALQDYGAYIVDDTAWNAYAFGVQDEAIAEFQRVYGYSFDGSNGPFHDDINKLFGALAIVDNNSADSVGGGGTPRAPLAPPFVGQK